MYFAATVPHTSQLTISDEADNDDDDVADEELPEKGGGAARAPPSLERAFSRIWIPSLVTTFLGSTTSRVTKAFAKKSIR